MRCIVSRQVVDFINPLRSVFCSLSCKMFRDDTQWFITDTMNTGCQNSVTIHPALLFLSLWSVTFLSETNIYKFQIMQSIMVLCEQWAYYNWIGPPILQNKLLPTGYLGNNDYAVAELAVSRKQRDARIPVVLKVRKMVKPWSPFYQPWQVG